MFSELIARSGGPALQSFGYLPHTISYTCLEEEGWAWPHGEHTSVVDHKPSQASDQSPLIWSLACMNRFRVSLSHIGHDNTGQSSVAAALGMLSTTRPGPWIGWQGPQVWNGVLKVCAVFPSFRRYCQRHQFRGVPPTSQNQRSHHQWPDCETKVLFYLQDFPPPSSLPLQPVW